jgi:hypothetical protein
MLLTMSELIDSAREPVGHAIDAYDEARIRRLA